MGWAAPDKYNIDVKHTVLGLPHWLVINRWEVRGTPPPVHQLPDGGVYRRGWHVNPIRLVVATLLWAVTAAFLLWISSVVSPPAAYWPYGVALGLAAVIGAAMPTGATGPTWISPASILGLLAVILVVAAVLGRSYWYASAEPVRKPPEAVANLIVRVTGNVIDKGMPSTVLAGVKVLLHKKNGQWLVTDAEGEPVRPGKNR